MEQRYLWECCNQKIKGFISYGFWDSKERESALLVEEVEARRVALEEFRKWASMEETMWRQKLRATWLRDGEKNTKFAQKKANVNCRRNFFTKVRINDVWLSKEAEIKDGCVGISNLSYLNQEIGDRALVV